MAFTASLATGSALKSCAADQEVFNELYCTPVKI